MTAETSEAGQTRPLAAILQDLRHGQVLDEAATELQALVRAVKDTGKKGRVVLTVEVTPMKGDSDALVVAASVKSAPPKGQPAEAVFFADDGNLVRDDPRQMALPGLRIAPGTNHDTVKDIAK